MADSWIQPLGDETRRVTIPHATAAAQTWTLDAAYTFFEGRTYPVGARGEHVTSTWAITSAWSFDERPDAEAYLQLLRDVAQETDARLEVHIAAPVDGTDIDFVGEAHDIPQDISNGTDVAVTFTQVDTT
jgi:hypothetical protein